MTAYSSLLVPTRMRPTDAPGRDIVTEAESDRGRVLFCPAFRRLQQKAQVFSMEPNAAVRSRLTHSLEVSQLGRYIADSVVPQIEKPGHASAAECAAFVGFVESACLMHDIGNPPFGHFGEAAIRSWFVDRGIELIRKAVGTDGASLPARVALMQAALADFKHFDGNPQGLRVVSRLQWKTDEFGLNLTATTFGSYLKYIRCAGEDSSGLFRKKAGYFTTERPIVEFAWGALGYASAQRFPLAYIMEAADDIAYCVSDLEDSIEKGVVQEKDAFQAIETIFHARTAGQVKERLFQAIESALTALRTGVDDKGREFTYTDFRTRINRTIVAHAAERYTTNHDAVLAGTLDSLLAQDDAAAAVLSALRDYCAEHVYGHTSIQRVELAGYTAIRGLLDHFSPLLALSADSFERAIANQRKDGSGHPFTVEPKLLKLFPEKYLKVYKHHCAELKRSHKVDADIDEWNARAHLVVDFVSGMTDDFAMTTYRTLAGMRL